jgi:hypothetical protein
MNGIPRGRDVSYYLISSTTPANLLVYFGDGMSHTDKERCL